MSDRAHGAYSAEEIEDFLADFYASLDKKKDEAARNALAIVRSGVREYGLAGAAYNYYGKADREDIVIRRNRKALEDRAEARRQEKAAAIKAALDREDERRRA